MIKLKKNRKDRFLSKKNREVNHINIDKFIKIKNSNKTFQIVGLNQKRNICWVREWPLKNSEHITFELSVNKICIPLISLL